MNKNIKGFSLLEMLIVVALFMAAVAMAVPQIRTSLAGDRLVTSVDQMAAELNMARTLAVSRNATYEFQLDTAARTYQIVDPQDPGNPPRAVKQLGLGVVIAASPPTAIRFFARGHSSGGAIMLASESGTTCQVTVQPSGHVRVGRYGTYAK
jgi:Tfp pilus assembly protein FimT